MQTHTDVAAQPVDSPRPLRSLLAISCTMFLVMLPVTMVVPVLKEWLIDRHNATPFWAHAFMSINILGGIAITAMIAPVIDRQGGRKQVLMACLLLNAAALWGLGVTEHIAVLFVLRFLEGAAHLLSVTLLMAMASDCAGFQNRGRTMGVIGSALMLGTTFGSPLGGVLGERAPAVVFATGAGICLFAVFVAWLTVRDHRPRPADQGVGGIPALFRERPRLLIPCAFTFIDRFCIGVLISTFMLFLADVHDWGPRQRGLLIPFFMVPFALLCYPLGRLTDRKDALRVMVAGSAGFGVVFACYGIVSPVWLPIVMLISGVLSAVMFAPSLALVAMWCPDARRASAFGGFNLAGSLGFMSGPLFGGGMTTLLGRWLEPAALYPTVLALAGTLELLCAGVAVWLQRRSMTGGPHSAAADDLPAPLSLQSRA